MVVMRRVMTYATVWGGATTLAILLVWFGARPVMHNAVFGEPHAQPFVDEEPSVRPSDLTTSPAKVNPPPLDSSTFATPTKKPSPSPAAPIRDHTYVIDGGRVVLAMTATSARLVSATPNPGYEVHAWRSDGWLRVDFAKDDQTSSLFVTWNGHPPTVVVAN
jgi:hypothetical protein